ncbi:enoyl-CoA hydratase/isomerase family protein [Paracraurococcus ruber]|uniref:3-hydroxybutyryl-CoA dehydratase n=1 Tax=Paracraurococcus ruber TaxID=77675 RepID=A0ABS1CYI5_9PROT|nr:enoyl-CoA hydratase/isomerase family protein [Paracraurococcus ruber]MBK1659271.1 3-hydroxybutyryl-CoA dehydratase [Paracraurococcus ruber]TDG31931.1 enoyl-CoA hydratase/isomerase family protein [Paracraurococcus ruber]
MSAAVKTRDEGTLPSLAIAGSRATLHLNRPAVMNRVQPEDIARILALLAEVEANPDVRVLVIASTGKAFSAGAHLGDMARQAEAGGVKDTGGAGFEDMINRIEMLRIPTIARLHGGVYGGSTDLALACDFRVGVTPATVMFMPAARIGVHYYESGLRRYVSRLGFNNAKRLFMLAEEQSSEELLRIGYLTDLVAPEALDARIDAIAARLGELAPLAVQGAKRAINEIGHQSLDVAALEERMQAAKASDDLREGLAAFKEKRKPVFRGR